MKWISLGALLLLTGCGKDLYFGNARACGGSAGPEPVRVGDYCIDSTEVSAAQYAEFLSEPPSLADQAAECAWNDHFEPQEFDSDNLRPAFEPDQADYPVSHVDFCDARAYCAWAGKRLCGKRGGGALPASERSSDESEWGVACAGPSSHSYPYGDAYDAATCAVTGDYHAVGSVRGCQGGYPGVFDMIGNVWEWEDSCSKGPLESATCSRRGGALLVMPENWACADAGDPSAARTRQGDMGIRCCGD